MDALKTAVAGKGKKSRKLHVTLFDPSGGRPYTHKVEPDDKNTFTIGDKEYMITPGSVWSEGSMDRCLANAANAQTINAATLMGDSLVDPETLHGMLEVDYWEQLAALTNKKGFFQNPLAIGGVVFGVIALLVLFWATSTISDGLEEIKTALEQIRLESGGDTNEGHQRIAPS